MRYEPQRPNDQEDQEVQADLRAQAGQRRVLEDRVDHLQKVDPREQKDQTECFSSE